ncbi:hypothetical protein [Halobacterium sp. KA-6]|uniref:hypothetical protein n=1 Tax=Halobacterium sp. KA-6 TaxID=2896368 RepID=UPI001E5E5C6C|nr:hypothetical protein [Halobacterium sp. KA-6]MCD2202110.1 hypothetical protein [Halobacterium sp. KA-6]
MTPLGLSRFFLGVAGVAYGTAILVEPRVLRDAVGRVFDVESRELSARAARWRRVAGVSLVAAGMFLLVFA